MLVKVVVWMISIGNFSFKNFIFDIKINHFRIERVKYMILDEDSDEKKSDSLKDWHIGITNGYDKASPNL